jgi:hypothetical protein
MRYNVHRKLQSHETCCWQGCAERGQYPAPKTPGNAQDYYVFCLSHVRAYNKGWNYFSHMPQSEAERFKADSITGHRPTSKRHSDKLLFNSVDILEEALHDFGLGSKEIKTVPNSELEALKTLGLTYPVDWSTIRSTYKVLAKTCHPDIHGKDGEERFKAINLAYHHLKTIYA